MSMLVRAGAIFVAALLFAGQALAQSPVLSLEGKVKAPQHWTLDDLRKMPSEHVDVSYLTDRGPVKASFTGVRLWALIQAAGGLDDASRGAALRHGIRITATDGWLVVTSTGEIAPDFGDKAAMVAFERDGKPLEDFRLIMPGDKRDGRYVHDTVTIAVE
jgi:hypothetical protein